MFFATVADLFQGRHFGSIQGAILAGFSLGGATSPWLAGFIHDQTGSYFAAFVMLLGSLLCSAVMMSLVAPRKIRPVSLAVNHSVLRPLRIQAPLPKK